MKITAHSLDILPTQKLSLPTGAKLLTVNVDHRFNKCLLWTFQDDNAPEEELTFTMAKLGDEVLGSNYVGTFKDNSGYVHVFAERPIAVTNDGEYFDKGTLMASIGNVKPVVTAGASLQRGQMSAHAEAAK